MRKALARLFGFNSRSPKPAHERPKQKPLLEVLEDRTVMSAAPQLLADLNLQGASSSPTLLAVVGDFVYFTAANTVHGHGLWKSNGTAEGTSFIKTLPDAPGQIAIVDQTLYFALRDANGRELWKSDGTAEGTILVKDIFPGTSQGYYGGTYPNSSSPQNLVAFNGKLYFSASDADHGHELWMSDGTAAGTVLVKDIAPGTYSSSPSGIFVHNGLLYFAATDEERGTELWKSDGTEAGTVLVKDIFPGTYSYYYGGERPNSSYPRDFVGLNGALYFTAVGANGREIWTSDGTQEGTVAVTDLGAAGASSPRQLTAVGNLLYFTARDDDHGEELWLSDGTAEGTTLVKDIKPGPQSTYYYDYDYGSEIEGLTNFNGKLLFTATDGASGVELWTSDGTEAGTVMVKDIHVGASDSGPGSFISTDGVLFFTAFSDETGRELWRTDGTEAGTVLIKDILPGGETYNYNGEPSFYPHSSFPSHLVNLNGLLYFAATDGETGRELWKSDGTTEGTALALDVNTANIGSFANSFVEVNGTVFFAANDGVHGSELWAKTANGVALVKDIRPGSASSFPDYLINFNGTLIFAARDDEHGVELWTSDGTAEGTVLLKDIKTEFFYDGYDYSNSSRPYGFTIHDGLLYFTAVDDDHGRELWKTDGTAEGTVLVKDIRPGLQFGYYPASSYPRDLVGFNGELHFRARGSDGRSDLWKTDGTEEGTTRVVDFESYLYDLVSADGALFITASEFDENFDSIPQLWISDGTAEGTQLIKEFPAQTYGLYHATAVNGILFFSAPDAEHGRELWKSDGTPEGTVLVKDIDSRPGIGSDPRTLTNVNGVLYFTASDEEHGHELWKSDGTEQGTVLVRDILPGPGASYPHNLINADGTLYFTAFDDDGGRELWKSDGTPEGTIRVADIVPGPGSSSPNFLAFASDALYFNADSGGIGPEPWSLSLADAIDLAVTVSDSALSAGPGDTLTYTINYSNQGDLDAAGVVLTETLPAGTTADPVNITNGWVAQGGGVFTFAVGSLASGASGSTTFVVQVISPAAAGLHNIVNAVSIADDGASGADGNPGNNTSADSNVLNAAPELQVSVADGVTAVAPGDTVTYTINYANLGNQDATGVVITETMPAGTTPSGVNLTNGWVDQGNGVFTFAVGALAADANGSIAFVVTVDDPVLLSEVANAVAIADDGANGADPNPGDNSVVDTNAVDGDGPVVTISAPSVSQTDHGPVVFTITYADPRLDAITLAAADVTLVATGTAGGTIVVSAGPTADTRLVSIQDIFGNGTLGIAIAAGTATDTLDNVAGAPPASETFLVQGSPQVSVKWTKPPKKVTKKGAVLTIRITNVGNQLAPDAVLSVTLPKHAVFQRPRSTAGWTGSRTLTFPVGNLGFGVTQNIKLAFKLKAAARSGLKSVFNAALTHGLATAPLTAKATIKIA